MVLVSARTGPTPASRERCSINAGGIVEAMRAIREVTPSARLIQTEDCGDVSGTDRVAAQVEHERHRQWLTWDLLTGRVQPPPSLVRVPAVVRALTRARAGPSSLRSRVRRT
jgi:hypothetical protein